MYTNFKTISFSLLLTLTAQASEDVNKTKIFNDKYLSSQKIDRYKDTEINYTIDYKISNIKNMTNVSKEQNATVSEILNKRLKADTTKTSQANEIKDHVKSKSFQEKIIENENHILYDKKINWQQHLGKYKKSSNEILKNLKTKKAVSATLTTNQFLDHNEKVFIVISSSIPDSILKNYFEMLQEINTDITFVIRGTIGGVKNIKPTLKWIEKVLTKSDGSRYAYNIIIEPRITKKYNIEKVPAVLYIQNYDSSYIKENRDEKHYVYYGTIDAGYALERINRYVKSEGLKKVIKNI